MKPNGPATETKKGMLGSDLKSRHSIPGTHARTRPGL